jgi:hypothetical protein
MTEMEIYQHKYQQLLPELSERARRLVVAADAKSRGRGGSLFVHNEMDAYAEKGHADLPIRDEYLGTERGRASDTKGRLAQPNSGPAEGGCRRRGRVRRNRIAPG